MQAKSSIHDEQPCSSEEDPKCLPPVPGAVPQSSILRSSYVKLHEAFATHLSETQWGPGKITQEELDVLAQSTPLYPTDTEDPGFFTMDKKPSKN